MEYSVAHTRSGYYHSIPASGIGDLLLAPDTSYDLTGTADPVLA